MNNHNNVPVNTVSIATINKPIDKIVKIPGSKSLTNRALCISALSDGVCTLKNSLFSDDTLIFANALLNLGIKLKVNQNSNEIIVHGESGKIPAEKANIFVGNAGTAARFITALASLGKGKYHIDGVSRMRERPMIELLTTLGENGAHFTFSDNQGYIPYDINANGIEGGKISLSGTRSSQPLSALLMIAPFMTNPAQISVNDSLVSEPFINMTIQLMSRFGVEVKKNMLNFQIPLGQVYKAQEIKIEPDATSASYFFAAAAITGGRIIVSGIPSDSLQGDLEFLEILRKMGCKVNRKQLSVEVIGPSKLKGIDVNLSSISDVAPTLAAIAPFAANPVVIRGIEHTRLQETDRISAVCTELNRLGVPVTENQEGMCIYPKTPIGTTIKTYDDHRIAMAFAVTGLLTPGIKIENPTCTSKTFPNFFQYFSKLTD